jgi:hypothetical protein
VQTEEQTAEVVKHTGNRMNEGYEIDHIPVEEEGIVVIFCDSHPTKPNLAITVDTNGDAVTHYPPMKEAHEER